MAARVPALDGGRKGRCGGGPSPDAGGWTDDTVTEDLDVSYRAQLRGWRFVYRDDYPVLSELPESLTAFKSQQRRWTKGGIQVARKLLRRVLVSRLPARVKREAVSHLATGLVHPLLVLFAALLVRRWRTTINIHRALFLRAPSRAATTGIL